jgi:hypothetical protein
MRVDCCHRICCASAVRGCRALFFSFVFVFILSLICTLNGDKYNLNQLFFVYGRDEGWSGRYLVFDIPTAVAKCAVSLAWIVRVFTELVTTVAVASVFVWLVLGDSNCELVNGPGIFVPSLAWFSGNSTVSLTLQATASRSFADFLSRVSDDQNTSYTLMSQFAALCTACGCPVFEQRFCGQTFSNDFWPANANIIYGDTLFAPDNTYFVPFLLVMSIYFAIWVVGSCFICLRRACMRRSYLNMELFSVVKEKETFAKIERGLDCMSVGVGLRLFEPFVYSFHGMHNLWRKLVVHDGPNSTFVTKYLVNYQRSGCKLEYLYHLTCSVCLFLQLTCFSPTGLNTWQWISWSFINFVWLPVTWPRGAHCCCGSRNTRDLSESSHYDHMPGLIKVDPSWQNKHDNRFESGPIVRALVFNHHITSLDLSGCLDAQSMKSLVSAFEYADGLTRLDVSGNAGASGDSEWHGVTFSVLFKQSSVVSFDL